MKRAFFKDVMKSVSNTSSRFLSIVGIVLLGAGVFAGLSAISPDMQKTGDEYYKQANVMDIRLLSTYGFTEDDVEVIKNTEGVLGVMPSYMTDVLSSMNGKNYTFRIHGLPEDMNLENENYINRPTLVEGTWPDNSGECVLVTNRIGSGDIALGDIITLLDKEESLNETLKYNTFKVVGFVYTPYYISNMMGNTSLGSGTLDYAMYVKNSDFAVEVYTDLYVTVAGAKAFTTFSDKYDALVSEVESKLEDLSDSRISIRYDEIIEEANEKLTDAKREYNDKKHEVNEKLLDALSQIEDAKLEIQDGEQELEKGQNEYEEGVKKLADKEVEFNQKVLEAQKEIDDGNVALNEGKRKLEDAYTQIEAKESEYAASKLQYDKGVESLTQVKLQLDTASEEIADMEVKLLTIQQQYDSGQKELTTAKAQLDQLDSEILDLKSKIAVLEIQDQSNQELPKMRQQLSSMQLQYEEGLTQYNLKIGELDTAKTQLDEGYATLSKASENLTKGQKEYYNKKEELEAVKSSLSTAREQIDSALVTLSEKKSKLTKIETELQHAQATLNNTIQNKQNDINDAKKKLDDALVELKEGQDKLDKAKVDLEKGEKEYANKKEEAEAKLEEAKQKIKDGEKKIEELKMPKWYVLDRNANQGFMNFDGDTQRMKSLATVFPIIFFLVAALVALTTMTRMVDEERIIIGTYKALGYSDWVVAIKYISYAVVASIIGSVIGIVIGFRLIPAVIWNTYSSVYTLPPLTMEFHSSIALIATIASVSCILVATMGACYSSFKEVPAKLMQPKAPKAGKRVFLENIKPLWNRLSFTKKVTIRNLFLNKKRFAMTVIGIAGCTALLLTGFGVRDAISALVDDQFEDIFNYNLIIGLSDNEVPKKLQEVLDNPDYFKDSLVTLSKTMEVSSGKEGTPIIMNANLVVPKNTKQLKDFIKLRERKSQTEIKLDDKSVVITEKLAQTLNLKVGDNIASRFIDNDSDEDIYFTITGITENYAYNYIYVSPEIYETVFGKKPEFNNILAKAVGEINTQEDTTEKLLQMDGIETVALTQEQINMITDTIDSINNIIFVLIISAGLLAFIVLYNLTNINVGERQREIATLKVLGFYDKEVNSYIYRETITLTIIGCMIGLISGIFLFQTVVQTVEVDMMMFGRTIKLASYVWATMLTMFFSFLVNLVINKKIKKIDMIESLKSVE